MVFAYIRLKNDPVKPQRRWKVREARSVADAYNEIAHARVLGSIGGRSEVDETRIGGTRYVLADVIEVNSDYTERKPYIPAY